MKHRRRFLILLATALVAVTLCALPATAQTLNNPRSSGVVGENFNGLAVVRDASASSRVRATVVEFNAKRRNIHAKRAAEQGVPADQVGRVYAKQIFRKASKGTWFLCENGRWTQKQVAKAGRLFRHFDIETTSAGSTATPDSPARPGPPLFKTKSARHSWLAALHTVGQPTVIPTNSAFSSWLTLIAHVVRQNMLVRFLWLTGNKRRTASLYG